MSFHPKGLTLTELLRTSNRDIVRIICDDQVKVIDEQLRIAKANGGSAIKYHLPINFDIIGMNRMDAQTLIYSELIEIYKQKEFQEENIKLQQESPNDIYLCIRWVNGMDKDEKIKRLNIIKRHLVDYSVRGKK